MSKVLAWRRRGMTGFGPLAAGVLLVAGVQAAVSLRLLHLPPVRPMDAPPQEFSATRAVAALRDVLGDEAPHPLGSEAGERVRERVAAQLRALGYRPEVQEAFTCNAHGTCATVRNVLARKAGREPGGAVLLAAHHDSVAAGPGASDDGCGVAVVLEAARALAASPPLRHDVVFLVDDGEEAGLLGAQAFVESPAAHDIRAVVNVEARGTSGPSALFETSEPNADLVDLYARVARRPVTGSALQVLYEALPNDTDLTVFKARGWGGLNFAFAGDVAHYHTPLDNLAHVSAATLQHHGDNALAALRALADSDLAGAGRRSPGSAERDRNAVFFDVLGFGIVRWPEAASFPLALTAALGVLGATALLLHRGRVGRAAAAGGFFGAPGALGAATAAAWAIAWALHRVTGYDAPWAAHPAPALVALTGAAVAAASAVIVAARRAGAWGWWSGVWGAWAAAGVATAVRVPGVSHLFIVPSLAALGAAVTSGALRRGASARRHVIAVLVATPIAAVLWLELAQALRIGIGLDFSPAVAVPPALLTLALAPVLVAIPGRRRWLVPGAAAGLALVASLVALAVPRHSADQPRRLNVVFRQDADRRAAWWVLEAPARGPLPGALLHAADFRPRNLGRTPWSGERLDVAAEATPLDVPPPALDVIERRDTGDGRSLRIRIRSPRGARDAWLHAPAAGLRGVAVHGRTVAPAAYGEWRRLSFPGLPPEGIELELELGPAPVEVLVVDRSSGLPPGGEALQRARPPEATPFQAGDATLVWRRVAL